MNDVKEKNNHYEKKSDITDVKPIVNDSTNDQDDSHQDYEGSYPLIDYQRILMRYNYFGKTDKELCDEYGICKHEEPHPHIDLILSKDRPRPLLDTVRVSPTSPQQFYSHKFNAQKQDRKQMIGQRKRRDGYRRMKKQRRSKAKHDKRLNRSKRYVEVFPELNLKGMTGRFYMFIKN